QCPFARAKRRGGQVAVIGESTRQCRECCKRATVPGPFLVQKRRGRGEPIRRLAQCGCFARGCRKRGDRRVGGWQSPFLSGEWDHHGNGGERTGSSCEGHQRALRAGPIAPVAVAAERQESCGPVLTLNFHAQWL